jgi:hypothetical protein
MAKPIRLTIKGSDASGTDAPTVDDLLGQVRDFVKTLRGVENAISDDGNVLVWRVTNVTMNSPISITVTPFSPNPAIFADRRATIVQDAVRSGFAALAAGEIRPAYFTDEVLPSAQRLYGRVLNGLADTTIEFETDDAGPPVMISREIAQTVIDVATAARPIRVPYREQGSIEGFVSNAERDGLGRGVLRFRSRLDGTMVKAVATGEAFHQLEKFRLGEVWDGVRIRVYGVLRYRDLGDLESMDATGIEVMDQVPLPGIADIIDPAFTGGLRSEAYLDEIRHG